MPLPVEVRPDRRIRPVLSFRWEAARKNAGNFSTSAKSSRTKGRTISPRCYQESPPSCVDPASSPWLTLPAARDSLCYRRPSDTRLPAKLGEDLRAFCPSCGQEVGSASFCPKCGANQVVAPAGGAVSVAASSEGLAEDVDGLLCYLAGWITGIIFVLIDKRPWLRFHSAHSMAVFGGLSVV